MTISAISNRVSYAGDGSTTAFSVSYPFFLEGELLVIIETDSDGSEAEQTLTTDYTVSGGAGSTGTVTMVTAPASGETLHIIRDTDAVQKTDLVNNSAMDAETLEDALDRRAMREQRLFEHLERCIRVNETSAPLARLDVADNRADKVIQFNSAGNPTLKSPSDLSLSASAVVGWQSVKTEGATGDGSVDDSSAFGDVQTLLNTANGGVGYVPFESAGYVIGDGATNGTAIVPSDKTHWQGDSEVKLIHKAKIAGGENFLFFLEDVEDVAVEGFEIDAGSAVRVGVTLRGTVDNVVVRDLHIHDCDNVALQYADTDTSTGTAYINNLLLENIRIDGVVGAAGAGSGINLFPRAGDAFSQGVILSNVDVDVTEGSATVSNHGPQALKLSNMNDVRLSNCRLRGGTVAALVLIEGIRDVHIDSLHTSRASRGITIDGSNAGAAPAASFARRIQVDSFTYRADGASGGDGVGINIEGNLNSIQFNSFDIDGDFRLRANANSDVLKDCSFGSGVIHGADFVVDPDGSTPTADITNFRFGTLQVLTPSTNTAVEFGDASWGMSNSSIERLYIESYPLQGLAVTGDDNCFGEVHSHDGNTGSSTVGTVVRDNGDRNDYGLIALTGGADANRFFLRKPAGNGITIRGVRGTPVNAAGFDFQNQENSDVPVGDVFVTTQPFDLSAGGASEQIYVADVDTYILGVKFLYWEASSADAGVNIDIRRDASSILTYTTETSQARFSSTNYINTSGTRSFATRKLAKGQTLDVLSAGGKTGSGQVMVQVSMVRARS